MPSIDPAGVHGSGGGRVLLAFTLYLDGFVAGPGYYAFKIRPASAE